MTGKDKRGVGSVAVVCSGKHVSYLIGLTQIDLTHTQKQALVLLDGTQATKESRYHDNGADGNDHVGSWQRGEWGREGGEAALRHRQPDAHAKQPAAT